MIRLFLYSMKDLYLVDPFKHLYPIITDLDHPKSQESEYEIVIH